MPKKIPTNTTFPKWLLPKFFSEVFLNCLLASTFPFLFFFFFFSFVLGPQFYNGFYYGYVLPKLAFCQTKWIKKSLIKASILKYKQVRLWILTWLAENEPEIPIAKQFGNCKFDSFGPFFSLPLRSHCLLSVSHIDCPNQQKKSILCALSWNLLLFLCLKPVLLILYVL